MKKLFSLTKRNLKEIIRDPLAVVFCLVFPVFMLVLLQSIFTSIGTADTPQFQIKNYAVGICVFGYTFVSMFTSMRIAGDKKSSFMNRINILPIKSSTYYLSFLFSSFPVCFAQTIVFILFALPFGFPFTLETLVVVVYLIPSMCFYITFGILIGVICNSEEKTGAFNSIIIQVVAIFGGIFMPINVFSGALKTIIYILPFARSILIGAEVFTVGVSCIYPHILYVLGYTILLWVIIVLLLKLKNKR